MDNNVLTWNALGYFNYTNYFLETLKLKEI